MPKISKEKWEAANWVASLLNDGYRRWRVVSMPGREIILLIHPNGNHARVICANNVAELSINGKKRKVYQHRLA